MSGGVENDSPTLGEPMITTFLFIAPETLILTNSVLFSEEELLSPSTNVSQSSSVCLILPGERARRIRDRGVLLLFATRRIQGSCVEVERVV